MKMPLQNLSQAQMQKTQQAQEQFARLEEEQEALRYEAKTKDKEIKELLLRNDHMHEAVKSNEARVQELQVTIVPLIQIDVTVNCDFIFIFRFIL